MQKTTTTKAAAPKAKPAAKPAAKKSAKKGGKKGGKVRRQGGSRRGHPLLPCQQRQQGQPTQGQCLAARLHVRLPAARGARLAAARVPRCLLPALHT